MKEGITANFKILFNHARSSIGQHGGAQHHEDGGEAHEGSAVQQGQQRALLGEDEAGAADRQEGEGGRGQGVPGGAQEAVHDQREREARSQVSSARPPSLRIRHVHPRHLTNKMVSQRRAEREAVHRRHHEEAL